VKNRTWQEREARKAKRLEKRKALAFDHPRKKKLPSHSRCEERYWKAFAEFIRYRDKDKGCFKCVVGPVEHAAHILSRTKRTTKYLEYNVFGMCARCNWMDKYVPGYHDQIILKYIRVYGLPHYKFIVELSVVFGKRPSRQECLEGEAIYQKKLAELKGGN
jgi:Bacteriophage Lambda NinG protein